MASSPSVQRATPNPSAPSASAGLPPRTRDWTRNGEPGSAFSGLSRNGRGGNGRGGGRGGGGGGRGGRGGRGGFRGGKPPSDSPAPLNAPRTETEKSKVTPIQPTPQTEKPSLNTGAPPSAPSTSRPKGPSRRASRTIPSVVVDPSSPSVETPPTPLSSRPQPRRKRSTTQPKPTPVAPKAKPPPLDESRLQPQKSGVKPESTSAPAKDIPPHLSNPPLRNDIDALVERVRAVAMAENRPTTPGSHIDWAGSDDDSLPDLDDWGVTTTSNHGGNKDSLMSPIVVEGLKALPEPVVLPPSPLREKEQLPSPLPTVDPRTLGNTTKKDSPGSSLGVEAAPHVEDKATKQASALPQRAPLHPSLPPKPIVTDTSVPTKPRQGATPMRNQPYPKTPPADKPAHKFDTSVVDEPVEPSKEQGLKSTDTHLEIQAGLAQSIHAPKALAESAPEPQTEQLAGLMQSIHAPKPSTGSASRETFAVLGQGLSASIYAPGNSESLSAPSDIASYSTSSESQTFNPTHNRAHTMGRSPPFTGSHSFGPNHRPSRSGASTPRGGLSSGNYHSRTHSSPPAGALLNNHRTPHSRPVITGDAISRLARTINSTSPSRVHTASAVSKD